MINKALLALLFCTFQISWAEDTGPSARLVKELKSGNSESVSHALKELPHVDPYQTNLEIKIAIENVLANPIVMNEIASVSTEPLFNAIDSYFPEITGISNRGLHMAIEKGDWKTVNSGLFLLRLKAVPENLSQPLISKSLVYGDDLKTLISLHFSDIISDGRIELAPTLIPMISMMIQYSDVPESIVKQAASMVSLLVSSKNQMLPAIKEKSLDSLMDAIVIGQHKRKSLSFQEIESVYKAIMDSNSLVEEKKYHYASRWIRQNRNSTDILPIAFDYAQKLEQKFGAAYSFINRFASNTVDFTKEGPAQMIDLWSTIKKMTHLTHPERIKEFLEKNEGLVFFALVEAPELVKASGYMLTLVEIEHFQKFMTQYVQPVRDASVRDHADLFEATKGLSVETMANHIVSGDHGPIAELTSTVRQAEQAFHEIVYQSVQNRTLGVFSGQRPGDMPKLKELMKKMSTSRSDESVVFSSLILSGIKAWKNSVPEDQVLTRDQKDLIEYVGQFKDLILPSGVKWVTSFLKSDIEELEKWHHEKTRFRLDKVITRIGEWKQRQAERFSKFRQIGQKRNLNQCHIFYGN